MRTLADELDGNLKRLASELQTLIKDENAPRYPSFYGSSKIPNECFSYEDAERAINLATEILDAVQNHYLN